MELFVGAHRRPISPGWRFPDGPSTRDGRAAPWDTSEQVERPDAPFPTHEHPGVEVTGALSGEATLVAIGESWRIQSGQVAIIPPQTPHRWCSRLGGELAVITLLQPPRDLRDALLPAGRPRVLTPPPARFAEYGALFERLVVAGPDGAGRQPRLLSAYVEAFLLALVGDEPRYADPSAQRDAVMREAVAYLREHWREREADTTLAQVAQRFSLSEATFRRHFHQTFGAAPKRYLLELRLAEAQRLLATTSLTLREIARAVGFYDHAHFSSTFRRHVGVAPSTWRRDAQR